MKEFESLPKELQRQKEEGEILEEYIYDDGIRNGKFYPEKKQGSRITMLKSGEYIVSWFLGDEEWNHIYEQNEKEKAYQDFKSIIMEEIIETVENEAKENAFKVLEEFHESDPKIVIQALNPVIYALSQNDEQIRSQAIDVLITLAERNVDFVKYVSPEIKKRYLREKDTKLKRKILTLLGIIGEKYPFLIKDLENNFISDLSSDNVPIITTLLSIYNRIGKKDYSFVKSAISNIINLSNNKNISISTLAKIILQNYKY
ncbi:MAG: hypothetical protein ACTSRG_01830 [Candidatus Helarchaeota archaeon]